VAISDHGQSRATLSQPWDAWRAAERPNGRERRVPMACCAYADFQGYRIVAPGTGHGLRRGQPSVHVCHAAQSAAISRCIAMILPRQIQGYAASWATARPYIRVLCFVQLPWLRAPILPGYPAKARGTYEARMNA
jgi:hypothetical protein